MRSPRLAFGVTVTVSVSVSMVVAACSIDITGSADLAGSGTGDGGPGGDATVIVGDDSSFVQPGDGPIDTTTPDAETSGDDAETNDGGGPDGAADAGTDAAPGTDAGMDAGNDAGCDAGGCNYALKFDGNVAGFVSAARPVSGSFTLEAWVNPTTITSSSDYYNGNLVFYSGDSSVEGFTAELYDSTMFGFATGTGSDAETDTSSTTVTTAAWFHLAIVRDQPNGTVNLYVNGAPQSQFSNVTTHALTGSNVLSIGGDADGHRSGFVGLIDEVRVWSEVRQPADIVSDYANTLSGSALTDPNLLLYWHFDEGAGTTATDSSPVHGFPGTFSTNHKPVYQLITTLYK